MMIGRLAKRLCRGLFFGCPFGFGAQDPQLSQKSIARQRVCASVMNRLFAIALQD